MPPFVSRKRHSSPPPKTVEPSRKRAAIGKTNDKRPGRRPPTTEENQHFLQSGHESDSSSLSSAESDDEDHKSSPKHGNKSDSDSNEESGSDDEENTWDDFLESHDKGGDARIEPQDEGKSKHVELTLDQVQERSRQSLMADNGRKKGPSAIEKKIRTRVHCIHVQCLMFHCALRNGWACDKKVQKELVDGLSAACKTEVARWKESCSEFLSDEPQLKDKRSPSKKGKKGPGKAVKKGPSQRDWGYTAGQSGDGPSDPTIRLLKMLSAYWRKRFTVTAPGYRKRGHKEPMRLAEEVRSFHKDRGNAEKFGERIESIKDFTKLAKVCEGSRDTGAQLFTALLRGLGLEARLVANLQPLGFGWSKIEEAAPATKSEQDTSSSNAKATVNGEKDAQLKPVKEVKKAKPLKSAASSKPTRSSGAKHEPIDLDSDSSLSSPPLSESEDSSIVEVNPAQPSKKPFKKYDRDLLFPVFWTEVLSPFTKCYTPVDPIVLSVVSSSPDSHYVFEPRGASADRAKQVLAYVVAYNANGSAKDVTVRYLKKHIWPGKTKGVRMPVESVPVYNRRGKVVKHEDFDWFKTAMSPYTLDSRFRTAADDIEDAKDLKRVLPVENMNRAANLPHSSLSWYKTSAEFVLARHLRREEALLPKAKAVRTFTIGKGEAAVEEPVYLRKDVVACKTAESWHKEGRAVKDEDQDHPLKHVPMRAVTLLRKREIEENERATGEKMQQPLYSKAQTDWIIPPPIQNGIIPKNAFGNMDVYVPSMVPRGAVHIPLRGTARICKNLDINFAEACTGFEFGNKRAVPVLTGVVVAKENEHSVIDAWEEYEAQKQRKEEEKREKLVLGMWRKLWTGLKIVERVRREYGEGISVEAHVAREMKKAAAASEKASAKNTKARLKKGESQSKSEREVRKYDHINQVALENGEDMAGGFLVGDEDQDAPKQSESGQNGGGFIIDTEGDDKTTNNGSNTPNKAVRKPISLQALQKQRSKASQMQDSTMDGANGDLTEDVSSDEDMRSEEFSSLPSSKKKAFAPKQPARSIQRGKRHPLEQNDVSKSRRSSSSSSELSSPASSSSSSSLGESSASSFKASTNKRRAANASAITGARKTRATAVRSKYFVDDDEDEDD